MRGHEPLSLDEPPPQRSLKGSFMTGSGSEALCSIASELPDRPGWHQTIGRSTNVAVLSLCISVCAFWSLGQDMDWKLSDHASYVNTSAAWMLMGIVFEKGIQNHSKSA